MKRITEELRKRGSDYPKDLKETRIPYSTVKHDLDLGVQYGLFIHDKNRAPYRWVDYDPEEPIIRKVLERYFPNGINAFFTSKYTVENDIFEEALKEAAILTGTDPRDQVFRRRFYKIVKKIGKNSVPTVLSVTGVSSSQTSIWIKTFQLIWTFNGQGLFA